MQGKNLILLGHGSKSAEATDDFNFIVQQVRSKSDFKNVEGAHMELSQPSLEEVIGDMYEKGERDIYIIPYFLFHGNHIKTDIPNIIDALLKKYSDLRIEFGSPIGKEPMMADIILKKIHTDN